MLELLDIPEGTVNWKAHTRAEYKPKEEGVAERNCCVLTVTHTHQIEIPTMLLRVVRAVWREGPGKSGKKGVDLLFVFLLLTTQISNNLIFLKLSLFCP